MKVSCISKKTISVDFKIKNRYVNSKDLSVEWALGVHYDYILHYGEAFMWFWLVWQVNRLQFYLLFITDMIYPFGEGTCK